MTFKDCTPPPDKEQDAKALAECMALVELVTAQNYEQLEGKVLDLLDTGEISGANAYRALIAMRQRAFGGSGMQFVQPDGSTVAASDVIPF